MDTPTVEMVDRIAALTEPVVRNLQISQCYHELSAIMAGSVGPVANWCTFATWASKQAGQSIRQEDLTRAFEDLLNRTPEVRQALGVVADYAGSVLLRDAAAVRDAVFQALNPRTAFDRTAEAIARGNRKVFEEIGREFARFVATFRGDSTYDPSKMEQFCQGLRPGEPPEGQQLLRRAFSRYYQAPFEVDPKTKTELVLLANLEIGLHEQTRLQPEILEAMNAPIPDTGTIKRRLAAAIFPGWYLRIRYFAFRLFRREAPLDAAIDVLADYARTLARRVISDNLLTLALPVSGTLRLGRDLRGEFPEALRHLANPELRALLNRVDPTADSLRESGATDWSDLSERMHLIADLFRSHHERQTLLSPPFTPEQVEAIKAGIRPQGRL